MTLVLSLPQDVDERLQLDADRKGVAKEELAVDIIARSVSKSSAPVPVYDFWSPVPFEALADAQGVEPVGDFKQWLASLPKVEGADELVEHIDQARRERREAERACP